MIMSILMKTFKCRLIEFSPLKDREPSLLHLLSQVSRSQQLKICFLLKIPNMDNNQLVYQYQLS